MILREDGSFHLSKSKDFKGGRFFKRIRIGDPLILSIRGSSVETICHQEDYSSPENPWLLGELFWKNRKTGYIILDEKTESESDLTFTPGNVCRGRTFRQLQVGDKVKVQRDPENSSKATQVIHFKDFLRGRRANW